jgi:endonuclease YncB( thermonuclease family)
MIAQPPRRVTAGVHRRPGSPPLRADDPLPRGRWPRRFLRPSIGALLAAALALGAGGCGARPDPLSGRVTRALDGDTIVVAGVGVVRYLGIDTPEVHDPRRPVERFGRRAWRANAAMVVGRMVRLETDRERRDGYGRLLAYVYLGRTMVNAELVRRGLARAYPFAPNTRHARLFARLEAAARAHRRGRWGAGEGGPPWGLP